MFEILLLVASSVIGLTTRAPARYGAAAATAFAVFVVSGEARTEPWLLAVDLALALTAAAAAARLRAAVANRAESVRKARSAPQSG